MGLGLVEWDLNWWNGTWTGGMGLGLVEWDLDWWYGTWDWWNGTWDWWNGTWTGGMGLGTGGMTRTGILQVWENKSLFIHMYVIDTHFSQPD